MGVTRYLLKGKPFYKVDVWVRGRDGTQKRLQKRKIPTKEQASLLEAKLKADSFDGEYFDRVRPSTLTVEEAWKLYEPVTRANNDSWQSDVGRAMHFCRHLGSRKCVSLTVEDINDYRARRSTENTRKGTKPSSTTIDREVELLKRLLNYAVDCKRLQTNPIDRAKLVRAPNVRRAVICENDFEALVDACDEPFKGIVVTAFETGMRKGEILGLRWEHIDLRNDFIRLSPQDTKANDARNVPLTSRLKRLLESAPRGLPHTAVFRNPNTGNAWADISSMWHRAVKGCSREDLTFHDLRRSFITRARRRGIPESLIMQMSGHRTRAVFDRYNVIEESDLQQAARTLGSLGEDLDEVRNGEVQKHQGVTG